jgi:hypothetical protein
MKDLNGRTLRKGDHVFFYDLEGKKLGKVLGLYNVPEGSIQVEISHNRFTVRFGDVLEYVSVDGAIIYRLAQLVSDKNVKELRVGDWVWYMDNHASWGPGKILRCNEGEAEVESDATGSRVWKRGTDLTYMSESDMVLYRLEQ